jgi:hypothetical protein
MFDGDMDSFWLCPCRDEGARVTSAADIRKMVTHDFRKPEVTGSKPSFRYGGTGGAELCPRAPADRFQEDIESVVQELDKLFSDFLNAVPGP